MSENNQKVINHKVIIGSILLAVLLCCLMLVLQVGIFPYVSFDASQKAILAITPVDLEDEELNTNTANTPTEPPQILPGVIALGMTVEVTEDGLRMRAAAGTDQNILFQASRGELLTIVDGPVIKDSLIWWKVESRQDPVKSGWSVQDYLLVTTP